MKLRNLFLTCAAAGAVLAGASFAFFQDEMMAPKPGPELDILKAMAGTWDAKVKMSMGPVVSESAGTEVGKMAVGDLWLLQDYQGEMEGGSFSGHGLFGYDQASKKYVGTWVDSWTTRLDPMEGTYDKEKKELTMTWTGQGPTGDAGMKSVSHMPDRDHRTFRLYMEGSPAEMMTIEYTRKK